MIGELCEMIVDDSRVVLTPELALLRKLTHDCFAQSKALEWTTKASMYITLARSLDAGSL